MLLTARWVLPITAPPIEDGAVLVQKDQILAVGKRKELSAGKDAKCINLGDAILMPGLVNVHSHLELTVLRGTSRGQSFVPWLISLVARSRCMTEEDFQVSATWGAVEALRAGVTCLADTTRTGASFHALHQAGLRGITYLEVFGMHGDPAAAVSPVLARLKNLKGSSTRVSIGISPHSPYTASGPLFLVVDEMARQERIPVAVHLAEAPAESELMLSGTGEIRSRFWPYLDWPVHDWQPPATSPVKYLDRLGVLRPGTMAVHCVQVSDDDVAILAQRGVAVAHCPVSNAYLGNGVAPLKRFLSAGIPVGLGTDSAASNDTIDLLGEIKFGFLLQKAVHGCSEGLTPARMVYMATLGGAQVLGLSDLVGSLEPGKKADLTAVQLTQVHTTPCYDPYVTLVHSARADDVVLTMVDGKVLYHNGMVFSVPESGYRKKVEELSVRLKKNHPAPTAKSQSLEGTKTGTEK